MSSFIYATQKSPIYSWWTQNVLIEFQIHHNEWMNGAFLYIRLSLYLAEKKSILFLHIIFAGDSGINGLRTTGCFYNMTALLLFVVSVWWVALMHFRLSFLAEHGEVNTQIESRLFFYDRPITCCARVCVCMWWRVLLAVRVCVRVMTWVRRVKNVHSSHTWKRWTKSTVMVDWIID